MNITFMDVMALYVMGMSVAGIMKDKNTALLVDSGMALVALLGYYLLRTTGYVTHLEVYSLFVILIAKDLAYLLLKKGNVKGVVVAFAFFFALLPIRLFTTLGTGYWGVLIFILPLILSVLAADCSDMKGYTTVNVAESIGCIAAFACMQAWFPMCVSLVYFIGALCGYIKFNKLSALQQKDKKENTESNTGNRAQRRAQAKADKKAK